MKELSNFFYYTRRERNGSTVLLFLCLLLLLSRWHCEFELTTATPIDGESIPQFVEAPKLNLNWATAEELQQLSGIGPVRSERIIQLRTELGKFDSLPQLLQVLPNSVLQAITPHVRLD